MTKPSVHASRQTVSPEEAAAYKKAMEEYCGPTDCVYAPCEICKKTRGWLRNPDGSFRCNQCGTVDPNLAALIADLMLDQIPMHMLADRLQLNEEMAIAEVNRILTEQGAALLTGEEIRGARKIAKKPKKGQAALVAHSAEAELVRFFSLVSDEVLFYLSEAPFQSNNLSYPLDRILRAHVAVALNVRGKWAETPEARADLLDERTLLNIIYGAHAIVDDDGVRDFNLEQVVMDALKRKQGNGKACKWILNVDEVLEQYHAWEKDPTQPKPEETLCGKPAVALNDNSPACAEHHAEYLRRLTLSGGARLKAELAKLTEVNNAQQN